MNLDTEALYAALMHEVKNALGLMAMNLDAIQPTGVPDHDGPLNDTRLLCERVGERLHQALLIYKARDGRLRTNLDAYSPADVLGELADDARALVRGRLEVEVRLAADLPALWFFDRNLVEMAVVNAIHNSIQYARSRIILEAGVVEGRLAVTVRDDSEGYPDTLLACIREDTPYESRGTGLGLRFAKMVALAHRDRARVGELRLDNDEGAVFRMLLP